MRTHSYTCNGCDLTLARRPPEGYPPNWRVVILSGAGGGTRRFDVCSLDCAIAVLALDGLEWLEPVRRRA